MGQAYSQTFEMKTHVLCYDSGKSILLCKESENGKNVWIKKIADIRLIDSVTEDGDLYYVSCETDDVRGYFLALDGSTGSTEWFIPGKSYFQVVFEGFLYIIFTDEKSDFYLLKVDRSNGKKIWHHRIDDDLCEYNFRRDRILLKYESGGVQSISPSTGALLHTEGGGAHAKL